MTSECKEISFRISEIIRITDPSTYPLNNEFAIRLEHLTTGFYINGGDNRFSGQPTEALMRIVSWDNPDHFLMQGCKEIASLRTIIDTRKGDRIAGKPQKMNYEFLKEVRSRLIELNQRMLRSFETNSNGDIVK
jgi:hypothetical protein